MTHREAVLALKEMAEFIRQDCKPIRSGIFEGCYFGAMVWEKDLQAIDALEYHAESPKV